MHKLEIKLFAKFILIYNETVCSLKAWSAVISLTVFMVYFFILREENGIDEILGRNTQETFEDLQSRGLISQQDIHENSPYASFVKDDTAPIYGK